MPAACSRRTRSTATGTARPAPRSRDALVAGHDVILKIDVQGAQHVKERVDEALLIFIVPPSLEALFGRLRARATETADELEVRQRNAAIELARQEDYDHVVVNETGQVERTAETIDADHRGHPSAPPDAAGPRLGRPVTLGLAADPVPVAPASRLVEVAVDAAGAAGARTYTYAVPDALADLEVGRGGPRRVREAAGARHRAGEAPAHRRPGIVAKPVLERVRADGPLLPPLGLALARWIARHYLAPAALVLRAMLPPGMLERLELVAELRPAAATRRRPSSTSVDRDLLDQLDRGAAAGARPRRARGPGRAGPAAPRARGARASSRSTGRCSPPRRGRATSGGSG